MEVFNTEIIFSGGGGGGCAYIIRIKWWPKGGKVSDILVTLRLSHSLSLWSPITAKEMVMRVAFYQTSIN